MLGAPVGGAGQGTWGRVAARDTTYGCRRLPLYIYLTSGYEDGTNSYRNFEPGFFTSALSAWLFRVFTDFKVLAPRAPAARAPVAPRRAAAISTRRGGGGDGASSRISGDAGGGGRAGGGRAGAGGGGDGAGNSV